MTQLTSSVVQISKEQKELMKLSAQVESQKQHSNGVVQTMKQKQDEIAALEEQKNERQTLVSQIDNLLTRLGNTEKLETVNNVTEQ